MNKFLNPYNFISLPKKKASAYEEDASQALTGKIFYQITTESPLFIPNTSTDEAFAQSRKADNHKSYDFFSYKELSPYSEENGNPKPQEPVIPGSEMRGVIRSVYETLTDSCMGVLNSETMPVKRSPEQFQPGLIRKNSRGYQLMKAESYRIGEAAKRKGMAPPDFRSERNGTRIFFRNPGISKEEWFDKRTGRTKRKMWKNCIRKYDIAQGSEKAPREMGETGYLIKWGMGVKKMRYHLFVPAGPEKSMGALSREDIETRLLGVIESYLEQPMVNKENQRHNKAAYEEYRDDLIRFLKGKNEGETYFPVTYSVLGNGKITWYLAPALYTKEISNHAIGKLAGEFAPCQDGDECPACALFGHVDKTGIGSKGSKLRFSDLNVSAGANAGKKISPEEYYYPLTTLPALAEPKLGNVEFYLKKPENATFWTYDYYYRYQNNGNKTVLTEAPGELRGRKYYWHHPKYCAKKGEEQRVKLPTDKPGTLNKTVRPLKKQISFTGYLYFEDISEKQLKQLIWILNSYQNGIGYKLGAAKPFGFGSISCQVLEVAVREISVENGQLIYSESKDLKEKYAGVSYEDAGFSKHCKGQFYRIAGLDSVDEKMEITYPKTMEQMQNGDGREGFRWFSDNHTNINGRGMPSRREQRKICVTLPALTDKEVGLPYAVSDGKPWKK